MFLLFNALSRFVIAFLPRSNHLLISWLQSQFAVILEPRKIKSIIISTFSPSICHEVIIHLQAQPAISLIRGRSRGSANTELGQRTCRAGGLLAGPLLRVLPGVPAGQDLWLRAKGPGGHSAVSRHRRKDDYRNSAPLNSKATWFLKLG